MKNRTGCGNDGPWKARETKGRFPVPSHSPWKSQDDFHIPAAPAHHRHGKVEIQTQDSHFPTAHLSLTTKPRKECQSRPVTLSFRLISGLENALNRSRSLPAKAYVRRRKRAGVFLCPKAIGHIRRLELSLRISDRAKPRAEGAGGRRIATTEFKYLARTPEGGCESEKHRGLHLLPGWVTGNEIGRPLGDHLCD